MIKSLLALMLAAAMAFPAVAEGHSTPAISRHSPETASAFVYAGDIYVASSNGGKARRLTSHAGQELFPKFSPDGTQIAFSAEYNGTRQVFVIPAGGWSSTAIDLV